MHYSEINKVRVTNKSGKFPLLHRTGWGPIKTTSYDNKHNFNTTMNNFLYGSGAPDMVTEEQIKVQYNEIFDAENDKIYEHATKHDLKKLMDNYLLTIRAAENVIRILPPLNVKKKEIDQALKIISKVCLQHK